MRDSNALTLSGSTRRWMKFGLPLCDETQVDVKLYGKRVFTIDHGQYLIQKQWEDKTKVE